ncbi:MAG: hypothetical protein LAP38_13185 [Acidobacteriia bacterium]|nr:hypothetical protein [Terriglobia bacterium]
MEIRENLFQLTQANTTHSTLHAIASDADMYPTGRENSSAAGLKMNATTRNATVLVYPVPVDFWLVSNMATSSVGLRRQGIGSPDLVQTSREWAEALSHSLL